MGSPLGPLLANIFMGTYEEKWLSEYQGSGPTFYRRYVDDIFCIFQNREDALRFLDYSNSGHRNIKFTVEEEHDGTLPFLNVLISHTPEVSNFQTTTYYKPTYTGLLLNFTSFAPFSYKLGLVKTLLDRAHKINSTQSKIKSNIKSIFKVLQKNLFPLHILNKVLRDLQSGSQKQGSLNSEESGRTDSVSEFFIKLPYIGAKSDFLKRRIREMVEKYCQNKISIKLVFTTCKIGDYFSAKDAVPKMLVSNVIYKFDCASCSASYVGETERHYFRRMQEHLGLIKGAAPTAVTKHLAASANCKANNFASSFSLIDNEASMHKRRIMEALYIRDLDPIINRQVKSYKLNLI